MNDTDRTQWIDNDEGLYWLWKRSGQAKWRFIKEHRAEIDTVIDHVMNSKKPAHYLAYGG